MSFCLHILYSHNVNAKINRYYYNYSNCCLFIITIKTKKTLLKGIDKKEIKILQILKLIKSFHQLVEKLAAKNKEEKKIEHL